MAKRNTNWTKQKLNRYLSEGRGMGELNEYKPWLTIQDFPSNGRASRIFSNNTTKRIHHLFSDIETYCFYIWDWDKNVIDIREHYPLLDLEETIDVEDINLDLFKDRFTGEPYILTTTFLLTVEKENRDKIYVARSVKSKSNLNKSTSIEKLEIERRYWSSKGIEWGIITEDNVLKQKGKNIEWIYGALSQYKDYGIDKENMIRLCAEFLNYAEISDLSIRTVAKDFEIKNGLKQGTGMFIFKYLIAIRLININMNVEINLNLSLNELLDGEKVI